MSQQQSANRIPPGQDIKRGAQEELTTPPPGIHLHHGGDEGPDVHPDNPDEDRSIANSIRA